MRGLLCKSARGFTLLEMLLVIFLMALVASTGLMLTEGVEDQSKYDETKRRMELIRKAIIGDPTRTVNGAPEISGFVADMGRLPGCLRELLELIPDPLPPNIPLRYLSPCDGVTEIPLFSFDTNSSLWAGWRGPYLFVLPDRDGVKRFRDGYGNEDTDLNADNLNFGWGFTVNQGIVSINSQGLDVNNNGDDITDLELIKPSDYQVLLGEDWQKIDVKFTTQDNNPIIVPIDSLRIRFNYPEDGILLDWTDSLLVTKPERDVSPYLTETFPDSNLLVIPSNGRINVKNNERIDINPAGNLAGNNLTLVAGTIISYTNTTAQTGQFQINSACSPSCTLTVPPHANSDGVVPIVTFNADGDLVIDAKYIEPTTVSAEKLAKSIISLPAGSTLTANVVTLPNGATITLTAGNSNIFFNTIVLKDTQATVSEAFTFSSDGRTVTTVNTNDAFGVPPGTTNPTGNTLTIPAVLSVPAGIRSLSVVCEATGLVFQDTCTNTDPRHDPQFLTITPRMSPPIKPAPLFWTIE